MQQKISDLFGWLGTDTGKLILAGAAGGVVRWLTLRNNWKEGSIAVIVGALCASYLGPLAVPLVEPVFGAIAPGGDSTGFAAFIVGMGGISLSGLIIDVINARRKKSDGG